MNSIKIITFTGCTLNRNIAVLLKNYTELEELYFIESKVKTKFLINFTKFFKHQQNLIVLHFKSTPLYYDHGYLSLVKFLNENKTVKKLILHKSLLNTNIKPLINAILNSGTIEYIDLSSNEIPCAISDNIANLLQSPSLKTLNVRDNRLYFLANISTIIENSQIEILDLSNNCINDEEFNQIVTGLKNNKKMIKLYLDNNKIELNGTDIFTKFISTNKSLKLLSLNNNNIDLPHQFYILKQLNTNRTLEHLYLDNNGKIKQLHPKFNIINGINLKTLHFNNFPLTALDYLDPTFINSNVSSLHICMNQEYDCRLITTILKQNRALRELHINFPWNISDKWLKTHIISALKDNYTIIKLKLDQVFNSFTSVLYSTTINKLLIRNKNLLELKYQTANILKKNVLHNRTKHILPKVIYKDCFETIKCL